MTEQPAVPVRVVVCAANRYGELIVLGARHFDSVMHAQLKAIGITGRQPWNDEIENRYGIAEQGFIDQWGVFMNRSEALIVATEAGQINVRRPKGFPLDKLFSEDLY